LKTSGFFNDRGVLVYFGDHVGFGVTFFVFCSALIEECL
jgi:hypothetical protein